MGSSILSFSATVDSGAKRFEDLLAFVVVAVVVAGWLVRFAVSFPCE